MSTAPPFRRYEQQRRRNAQRLRHLGLGHAHRGRLHVVIFQVRDQNRDRSEWRRSTQRGFPTGKIECTSLTAAVPYCRSWPYCSPATGAKGRMESRPPRNDRLRLDSDASRVHHCDPGRAVYQIPADEWRYVDLELKQAALVTRASRWNRIATSGLAMMRREDVERLRRPSARRHR